MPKYSLLFLIAVALFLHLSPQLATAENGPEPGACDNPALTDNGLFTIEFNGITADGDLVTFSYEVCQVSQEGGPENPALSHWSIDLLQIDCLLEGIDLEDLVVGGTVDGEPAILKVGTDGSTGFFGVKFDDLDEYFDDRECHTYTITFDTSVLTEGYTLGTGWVDAVTKAGSVDPGYACILGPVCVPEEEDEPEYACETAFAHGGEDDSTCFLDIDELTAKRWGWTIGPLDEGGYEFDLYAGAGQCDLTKGTYVGALHVLYSDGAATVVYLLDDPYELTETHLYVGNDPLPVDRQGNPTVAPGQYPYQNELDPPGQDDVYFIEGLDGEIYIIAHAVVCGFESDDPGTDPPGDGDDPTEPPGDDPDPERTCETAYAHGGEELESTCFTELGFGNWGWTVGPIEEGSYTLDIWAAAGRCDLSRGELAGSVTVDYEDGVATVTFWVDAEYELAATHVYIGDAPLPKNPRGRDTVAPGQYGNTGESVTVDGLEGDIYVIAHAVVCKEAEDEAEAEILDEFEAIILEYIRQWP